MCSEWYTLFLPEAYLILELKLGQYGTEFFNYGLILSSSARDGGGESENHWA